MPYFEIVYSEEATSKALTSKKVQARNRTEAATDALKGLADAQSAHGAKCFRVLDGLGMVVARGPI
jgi:glucose-6-phosphate isomerase